MAALTPRDIIDEVLEDLERPDFLAKAEKKFYAAVKSAHTPKFRRDIKPYTTATISRNSSTGTLQFQTPPELRQILSVSLFSSYTTGIGGLIIPGNEISLATPYIDSLGRKEVADYYGFRKPNTFTLDGSNISLTNTPVETTCVQISGLFWPSFTFSSTLGDYESDSWILREYPALISAYLFQALALLQTDQNIKQNASIKLQQAFTEFHAIYAGDSF